MRRFPIRTLAAALLLSACAGGSDGGGGPATGWLGMLGLIPDTPDNRQWVVMEDLAGIRADLGIEVPSDPTDARALADYVMTVSNGLPGSEPGERSPALRAGVFQGGTSYRLDDLAGWPGEVGFSIAAVDADVSAGRPPETTVVYRGSIDRAAVAAAVGADPLWGGDLRTRTSSGTEHWCWGDDPLRTDLQRISAFRPLGRGGCLAVAGGDAYRTLSPDVMDAALAVRAGEAPSLAGYEAFALAAGALEDAGTYAAALTTGSDDYAAASLPEPPAAVLDRWEALGVGAGFGDGGEYMVMVLVYGDEGAASANAATLQAILATGSSIRTPRPWAEIVEGGADVRTDGRMVVAVLSGTTISLNWMTPLIVPDTLTAWG